MKKLTSFEKWISTNKIQLEGQRSEKPNEYLAVKKEVSNDHNEMIKNNLHDILDYATDLLGLVDSNSELEEWMDGKQDNNCKNLYVGCYSCIYESN